MLLVYSWILTKEGELYKALLGRSRDYGMVHENCPAALQQIIQHACMVHQGRRRVSPSDAVDDGVLRRLRDTMRAGASDGGRDQVRE